MTRKKRTKKTRIGANAPSRRLILGALAALLAGSSPARDKKKSQPEAFAVVAGTVFRVPGFALPGAVVSVTPEAAERAGVKFKIQKMVTDARGEFAVRVPPVPMTYLVRVQSSGYQSQQKSATIEGEHRRELTFQLEPEQK